MTATEVQLMIVYEWNEWEICSQTVLKVVVVVEEVVIEEGGGQRGARVPQRRASVLSSLVTNINILSVGRTCRNSDAGFI